MKEKITYYKDLTQGTDEWLNARLGIVTASQINTLFTATGKPAKNDSVRKFARKILAQRLLKKPDDNINSYHLARGHLEEEIARDIYSENYEQVNEVGFIVRDFGSFKIGASPDGLVGELGGIEIKSRIAELQIKTINEGDVPKEYMNQIQTCLMVSGREWWDFISYSNGMEFFVMRVFPDVEKQEAIIQAVESFEEMVQELKKEYAKKSKGLIKAEYVELNFGEDELIIGEE